MCTLDSELQKLHYGGNPSIFPAFLHTSSVYEGSKLNIFFSWFSFFWVIQICNVKHIWRALSITNSLQGPLWVFTRRVPNFSSWEIGGQLWGHFPKNKSSVLHLKACSEAAKLISEISFFEKRLFFSEIKIFFFEIWMVIKTKCSEVLADFSLISTVGCPGCHMWMALKSENNLTAVLWLWRGSAQSNEKKAKGFLYNVSGNMNESVA